MEGYSRDFKGVWIPKDVWLSPKLSLMEKVLFVELHSLDNERGCYASNRYFAEFFGVSERQIRTHIGTLKAKGFISVTIHNRNQRIIRVVGKYARVTDAKLAQIDAIKSEISRKFNRRQRVPGR
jgi:biotin operon repressor